MNPKLQFVWVLILILMPVLSYAEHSSFGKMGIVSPKISKPAPDFEVKNIKGERKRIIRDYKN